MNINELRTKYDRALNKLCKWRMIFAGWQLGTRPNTDPEAQAVRDTREAIMLLRVEVTTLTKLLMDKGLFTEADFMKQAIEEAEYIEQQYEKKFPGFKATDTGMDVDVAKAKETMKGWRK